MRVDDVGVEGDCTHASAAGATAVIAVADPQYVGRGYACPDLESHLWWFGRSDPWAA